MLKELSFLEIVPRWVGIVRILILPCSYRCYVLPICMLTPSSAREHERRGYAERAQLSRDSTPLRRHRQDSDPSMQLPLLCTSDLYANPIVSEGARTPRIC